MNWIKSILIYILAFAFALEIKSYNITLKQVHPKDETNVIFQNRDYFVFNSEVYVTGHNHLLSAISFEIKSKTSSQFQSICDINVEICDTQQDEHCVCSYNSADNKYFIIINITAQVIYSAGTVRGALVFKDNRIYSNNTILPLIFDTPDDVCLFIDAQKVTDLSKCNETTSKDMAVLVYFCSSASSYKLEIEDDSKNISNGSNVVVHTLNTTSQRFVTFYQKDLVSNKVLRTFQCTVHSAPVLESCPQQEEDIFSFYNGILIVLIISNVFFLVIVLICYIKLKSKKKMSNAKKQVNDTSKSLMTSEEQENTRM